MNAVNFDVFQVCRYFSSQPSCKKKFNYLTENPRRIRLQVRCTCASSPSYRPERAPLGLINSSPRHTPAPPAPSPGLSQRYSALPTASLHVPEWPPRPPSPPALCAGSSVPAAAADLRVRGLRPAPATAAALRHLSWLRTGAGADSAEPLRHAGCYPGGAEGIDYARDNNDAGADPCAPSDGKADVYSTESHPGCPDMTFEMCYHIGLRFRSQADILWRD